MPRGKKISDDSIREVAAAANLKWVDGNYENQRSKLKWLCVRGHVFPRTVVEVKRAKHKCPDCHKVELMKAQECKAKKFILLLSGDYRGNNGLSGRKARYFWICKSGHKNPSSIDSLRNAVKAGTNGCQSCSGKKKKTLEEISIEVQSRDPKGKVLSKHYVEKGEELKFLCGNGHSFNLIYNNFREGQWCKDCKNKRFKEKHCRALIEYYTGHDFPERAPAWNLNKSTGGHLRLDGYNELLQLAFEYDGVQHFKEVPFFHDGEKNSLLKQRERDAEKDDNCRANEVHLIRIACSVAQINLELYQELEKWAITKNFRLKPFEENPQLENPSNELDEFKAQLKSRGTTLISSSFLGVSKKHDVECDNCSRTFEATPRLESSFSCNVCSGRRLTTEVIARRIALFGVELKSQYGGNPRERLEIACKTCQTPDDVAWDSMRLRMSKYPNSTLCKSCNLRAKKGKS